MQRPRRLPLPACWAARRVRRLPPARSPRAAPRAGRLAGLLPRHQLRGGRTRRRLPLAGGWAGGACGGGAAAACWSTRQAPLPRAASRHGSHAEPALPRPAPHASQVLRLPADCYCVLLHADVAASWRLPAARAASGGGSSAAGDADAAAAGMAALGLSQPPAPGSSSGTGGSRPSSSGSLAGSSAAQQAPPQQQSAVVFSGYVSHQQLTAALGSQLLGDPVRQVLRAAAAASRRPQQPGPGRGQQQQQQQQREQALATCRVSMRGPGGRGAADVAVSSYPPAADAGHLPGSASDLQQQQQQQQQLAASPSGSGRSSGSGSSRPGLFERAQLLARGVAAAARTAAAQAAGGGGGADLDPSQLRLRCSLMSLQVPVEALAEGILRAL